MPKPIEDRIAAILGKREKLDARLDRLTAAKKTEERKRDTRRKIVIGGAILAELERDPSILPTLRRILVRSVTRTVDRAVIADLLPPSPATREPT